MSENYVLVDHEKPFRYDEDGLHVTRGSAWSGPGCHIGCGVLVYTDDEGRLVKVEGDKENPFNKGRLCTRCLALTEMVYNEGRITTPMKRAFEDRGLDRWEPISWDEAYDLIYDKFMQIKEESGPWAIGFWQGTGRDIAAWITRLAWSFGSPNYCFNMTGMSCYVPRVAGCAATTGAFWVGDFSQQFADRYDNPEWKAPANIVIWGNNPLVSNSDGLYGHWIVDCMKRGSELIVIDPKVTWLAAKAKHYLQIRPGTDAALALAMVRCIVKEDLYDHDFVDCWCYGFDELVAAAEPYTPEKAAEITWIPAEKIEAAARAFATGGSGVIQWGVAVDMTKEALPAATFVERNGIRTGDGALRGETINKCIQVGECKPDAQINLELGKRFNPEAWPWDTVEEMYDSILECTGYKFAELQEVAPAYIPFTYERHVKGMLRADGQPGFNTQTGRIELWSNFYHMAGLSEVPYFEEPTPGPTSTPDLYQEYPLVLTTGARNWSLFHSEHRQAPHLRALHPWPWVQMNPKTAEELGVTQGEWVWVENERGRCKRVAEITPIMPETTVSTDHAWWYPEGDPENLYDVRELNVGNLIPYLPGKAGFGGNYKSMLCKIYKVGEEN